MIFEVIAFGHKNITARHYNTLQVTKDREISKRADCVIGVKASMSASEIPEKAKAILRDGRRIKVEIFLPDYGIRDFLFGFGSEKLSLTHERDIVIRKSRFICGRTVLISASKSALEISREIVKLLKDEKTEVRLLFDVEG
uniref:DUF371 domain-containing protein n=1 Tax=Archaeoglobus fulgidus TaxID=2234 RepID=A0A7J2TJJ6_ARCFL